MRLKCSEAGQLAFDFTVMRAHDIYVDTMFRLAMRETTWASLE
jgi:hypothetical protein